ncbi:exonuclease 1-like isoform X4 [Camellia sinensis]|uniref:exonuclease 1-like isoform X4 n=1 Tax=Camellia sinensis TaxID=4442 RepID=UPI0010358118|nr:exonuclease 1-like isoform X4 [Camellia sinensis]XP_028092054.1 exonuclease 1-like isoform X4 [Camellia sinensis]
MRASGWVLMLIHGFTKEGSEYHSINSTSTDSVSPCEADAQLAYLSSLEAEKGGIVAVTSEDSDLLAYGCPTVVFKMDRYGNGEEIVQNKVFESASRVPSFQCFDKELFTGMCA